MSEFHFSDDAVNEVSEKLASIGQGTKEDARNAIPAMEQAIARYRFAKENTENAENPAQSKKRLRRRLNGKDPLQTIEERLTDGERHWLRFARDCIRFSGGDAGDKATIRAALKGIRRPRGEARDLSLRMLVSQLLSVFHEVTALQPTLTVNPDQFEIPESGNAHDFVRLVMKHAGITPTMRLRIRYAIESWKNGQPLILAAKKNSCY